MDARALVEPDFKALFEQAPSLHVALDVDFRIVAVSDAYLQATRTRRDDLVGRCIFDVFPDDPGDPASDGIRNTRASLIHVKQARTADAMAVQRHDIRRPDSEGGGFEVRYWSPVNAPVLNPDGSIAYLVHRIENVTDFVLLKQQGVEQALQTDERKRAEQALRDNAEQLRLLVEHTPAAVAMFDREMRYLAVSHRFSSDLRVPAQSLIGRSHYEVFPEIPERWREIHRRCLAGAVEKCDEDPFPRPDGTIDWIRWEIRPWYTAAGEIGGIVLFSEVISERKRSAEALRASEARYRSLFDHMSDGLAHCQVIYDGDSPVDFIYLDVNPAFEDMTGVRGVVGKKVSEVHPGLLQSMPHLAEIYGRVAHGTSKRFETYSERLRNWFDVSVYSPATDHLVATFHVITDRKRAEEGLRESEQRLRLAQEAARIGAFEWDIQTGVNTWTPELEAMYGLPRGGFAKTESAWESLVHPDDRTEALRRVEEAIEAGDPAEAEWRVVWPDGSVHWMAARWKVFKDASGKPLRMTGINIDITERKRAEKALCESEQRYRALVTASSDVVYRVSPDWSEMRELNGREIVANTAAPTRLWLDKYVHPDDQPRVKAAIDEAIRTKSTYEVEHRFVRVDGSLGWTLSRAIPLVDASGAIVEWFGTASDITEHKRNEELRTSEAALREGDRQKNQFLAMLSHELRNPLAPIRNSLYILQRAAPGGEQARRAQTVIDRQIGHMSLLIDDLLDVTRITRGKIRLQRERLDLNDVAQRTVEDHRTLFAKSDVRLEVLPAPAEVWVDGDRIRLAQAIANLLQNAVKFTSHGGKTTLSVEADIARGQASVTVRDTGAGITPEMLPRLFHAFTQADSTLDRSKGGLGLGLALVKGLVELHGGSVSAASGGPGKGAAFTIMLPLDVTAARTKPAAEPVRSGAGGAPRRVLVIEDNDDAADTLCEVLELTGHIVEVAYSGRDGIEKARAFHPDVVLCDIGLPEMDGYEVARTIRADPGLGRVALVAVSGYAQPEDVATASEAGFDAHLAKPPSIETLERVLAGFGNTRREDRPDPSWVLP